MYLQNNQPKVITYRDYENFDNSRFSEELQSDRSSRLQVFCSKGVFSNFNFIKKETLTQVFSCEFCKISKNTSDDCFWSEIENIGPLNKNISIFHNVCIEVLERYGPEKQKCIRANHANFMDSKKVV